MILTFVVSVTAFQPVRFSVFPGGTLYLVTLIFICFFFFNLKKNKFTNAFIPWVARKKSIMIDNLIDKSVSLPSDQNNKSENASPNNLISELETTFCLSVL